MHGRPDLSQVPGKLRPLLRRSLAKDPARRPTADQFLADLTAAYPSAPNLTGDWLPPQILAASPAPVLAPDGDRHEPVASGPRSVAVPPAPPTQTAAAPPAPAAGRRRLWPWVAAGSTVCAAVIAILIVSLIPGSASAPTVPPNTRCVAFHPTPSAPRGTPISGSIKGSRR